MCGVPQLLIAGLTVAQGAMQMQASNYNASLAKAEAKRIGQFGVLEENAVRRRNDTILGQQIVDMAASGDDPTTGTNLDVAFYSAREAEMEALLTRADYQMKREGKINEARQSKMEGKQALASSFMSAGTYLLKEQQKIPALE